MRRYCHVTAPQNTKHRPEGRRSNDLLGGKVNPDGTSDQVCPLACSKSPCVWKCPVPFPVALDELVHKLGQVTT